MNARGPLQIEWLTPPPDCRDGTVIVAGVIDSVHGSILRVTIQEVYGPFAEIRPARHFAGDDLFDLYSWRIRAEAGERIAVVITLGLVGTGIRPAADLRPLLLLWDAAARASWLASPDDALAADLAVQDLALLASEELARRGALTTHRLLGTDHAFLYDRFMSMPPASRERFIAEAVTYPDRADATLSLLSGQKVSLGALTELAARLDPATDPKPCVRLESTLRTLATIGSVDFSAFARFLVRCRRAGIDEDTLPRTCRRLDAPAKRMIALDYFTAPHPSLKHYAEEFALEVPDPAYLPALEKLEVGDETMAMIFDVSMAVSAAFPGERDRVREMLKEMPDRGLDAQRSQRLFDAFWPRPPGPPVAQTFELASPGDRRRLPGEVMIWLKRDERRWPWICMLGPRRSGSNHGLDPGRDGHREYWVEPYVVVVDRIAAGVRVTVTPHASKPAALTNPEACRQAAQAAKRAGYPLWEHDQTLPWEGRHEHVSSNEAGARVFVVVGLWSGLVLVDPPGGRPWEPQDPAPTPTAS